ncbi:MAG: apolipoprotein N-acyltransferase [Luteolibacter sp.]|uniref:apolipoprotein N-acyltransferase n=1 Tax=Luteolibacter sp. TaxID=1962973 RepID=UPI003263A148
MGRRSGWMRIAAAIVSGLLVAGAFPPLDFTWLVWVGMLPLLWALWSVEGKRAGWKGFGIGYLTGLVACLIQFNWVASVSWLGAILLPAYLATYWGLFGIFAAKIGNPWKSGNRAGVLTVAFCHGAVWAGCELLRGWVITGISWNVLGTAFHDTPHLAQAADLFGVVGLSMALVFFQAVVVQAAVLRKLRPIVGAVAVIGMMSVYGRIRIQMEDDAPSVRLKTLLVQLNIPQEADRVLWTALQTHQGYEEETTKALAALKSPDGQPSASWPDWVMWPEIALTGWILNTLDGEKGMYQVNWDTISQVREAGPFTLFFGAAEGEAEDHGEGPIMNEKGASYNSLAVMSPTDEMQTYRKEHLVIFGETIPFLDTFPFLKKIYEEQAGAEYHGSFNPGTTFDPLPVAIGNTEVGAIPTICFEDSVPRLTRKFLRPGPQVIVNVTNDGWFKQSAAADQHFQYARFRAIELRRPMLRCANSGVSAAISSTGSTTHPDSWKSQILTDATGSHFTRGSLLTELKIPLHPTFSLYALLGDTALALIATFGLFLPILQRKTLAKITGPDSDLNESNRHIAE